MSYMGLGRMIAFGEKARYLCHHMREQHVKWKDGLTQNEEAKQILRKMIEAVGKFGAAVLVAP